MTWHTLFGSEIGGRDEQQDRYFVAHNNRVNGHVLAVADGAGGHLDGAKAAQTAIDYIEANVDVIWHSKNPEADLKQLVIDCNQRVLAVGDSGTAYTTLVLVLLLADQIFWVNVGDSRLYLVRDGLVSYRTTDHSIAELKNDLADDSPSMGLDENSNGLYMCLGAMDSINPDTGCSLARADDIVLLCSDGLWGQSNVEDVVANIASEQLTQTVVSDWLEQVSNNDPRSDNVTLIVSQLKAKSSFVSSVVAGLLQLFR